ncbi:hypothetical protein B0H14DRAFT_3476254 [Mycena olivaceomarginata]|nr:hypothetical protein B0H14DRAFT_3476254 [Mycena olivaceomarginata]
MDELEGFDLGEPIICEEYDLEEALKRENEARLAREASGAVSEEDELEVEEATGLNARHEKPAPPPQPTAAASQPLTGREKKKQQNRARQRAKRKADTPPSQFLSISFSADGFRATKQRWTGLTSPLEHPLLPHADEPDILKKHMRYIDWNGEHEMPPHPRSQAPNYRHISPTPVHPDQWAPVVEAATAAMRAAREKIETDGFAFGGGRQTVGNIKQRSGQNRAPWRICFKTRTFERMATTPSVSPALSPPAPALIAPLASGFSSCVLPDLLRLPPDEAGALRKNLICAPPFPQPFCRRHRQPRPRLCVSAPPDGANKADGMCLVGALGPLTPTRAGTLVCWDYDLIIRVPRRLQHSIPSAVVTHSNTPIQAGEEHYSIIHTPPARSFAGWPTGSKRISNGTRTPRPTTSQRGRLIAARAAPLLSKNSAGGRT